MPTWTRLIGGWILALVVALALSWGAVSMVRGSVIESSGAVADIGPGATDLAGGSDIAVSTSSTVGATSDTVAPLGGSTSTTRGTAAATVPSTPSTTDRSTRPSSTTVTSPTSSTSSTSTTSTTVARPLTTKTYQLTGGSVTISFAPGVVNFKAAVPQSGYSTDVKDKGPGRVRVEFEKDDTHSEFEAEWISGELVITIEE